jgi:hypothetical protein
VDITSFLSVQMYFAFKKYKEHRARQVAHKGQGDDQLVQQTSAGVLQDASVTANTAGESEENNIQEAEIKNAQKTDPSPDEVAEKKRRRSYRWKIIFGLWCPFALQALDTTIIASALPYIATDFRTYSSPCHPSCHHSPRLLDE